MFYFSSRVFREQWKGLFPQGSDIVPDADKSTCLITYLSRPRTYPTLPPISSDQPLVLTRPYLLSPLTSLPGRYLLLTIYIPCSLCLLWIQLLNYATRACPNIISINTISLCWDLFPLISRLIEALCGSILHQTALAPTNYFTSVLRTPFLRDWYLVFSNFIICTLFIPIGEYIFPLVSIFRYCYFIPC